MTINHGKQKDKDHIIMIESHYIMNMIQMILKVNIKVNLYKDQYQRKNPNIYLRSLNQHLSHLPQIIELIF
jgi:hypothetical protein